MTTTEEQELRRSRALETIRARVEEINQIVSNPDATLEQLEATNAALGRQLAAVPDPLPVPAQPEAAVPDPLPVPAPAVETINNSTVNNSTGRSAPIAPAVPPLPVAAPWCWSCGLACMRRADDEEEDDEEDLRVGEVPPAAVRVAGAETGSIVSGLGSHDHDSVVLDTDGPMLPSSAEDKNTVSDGGAEGARPDMEAAAASMSRPKSLYCPLS